MRFNVAQNRARREKKRQVSFSDIVAIVADSSTLRPGGFAGEVASRS